MSRIEDQLSAAADRLHDDVRATVDVEAALGSVDGGSRHRRPRLLAAAVLVVSLLGGGLWVLADRAQVELVADGGTTTSIEPPSTSTHGADGPQGLDVGGGLVVVFAGPTQIPVGTLSYAGTESAFGLQWRDALGRGGVDPPEVDFAQRIVVSLTTCSGRLLGLDLVGDELRPRFVGELGTCGASEPHVETYAVTIARSDLPPRFRLVMPTDGGHGSTGLDVDLSSASAVRLGRSEADPGVQGPDLVAPEPGREITFDRIGEVGLGQGVPTAKADLAEFHPCGYWPAGRSADEFDDPGQAPTGLVDASGATPELTAVYIRTNPTYRTASGVGVGTTITTLERIYGDDLVVDHPDPDATPTEGLVAYYRSVAAIRRGDRALTFYLRGDVVEAVKLSGADFWGDDEGCA